MTAFNMIKQAALVVSAGALFTACASMDETDESSEFSSSYSSGPAMSESSGSQTSYSSQNYSSPKTSQSSYSSSAQSSSPGSSQNYQSTQSSQSSGSAAQNEVVIPLHEEQFNVGKRTVSAGQVTIRKIVTTETVNQPVQLRRERVIIEREGAGAEASSQASVSSSAPSASAQAEISAGAPAVEVTSTEKATRKETAGVHQKNRTVGAQLNQRAADINRTVAGNEPVGKQADYNTITGVPRTDDSTETETSDADLKLPAGTVTREEQRYTGRSGAEINEAAGAQPSSQQSQSYSTTTSSPGAKFSGSTSSRGQNYSGSTTSSQSAPAGAFQEQTYTIQLNAEEPVVQKNVVQTGRVVARKNADWKQENISQQIRREDVQIDKGNAENVELRGNFNEAAGASKSQKQSTSSQKQDRENSTRGGAEDLQQPDQE